MRRGLAIRFDYRLCISDRVLSDFYKPFALVDIPESAMLLFDLNFALLASSEAAFHDKPIVSSETFSCIYGWGSPPLTPTGLAEKLVADLRCVADAQFSWGVNRVVLYGKPFSPEEDPKSSTLLCILVKMGS